MERVKHPKISMCSFERSRISIKWIQISRVKFCSADFPLLSLAISHTSFFIPTHLRAHALIPFLFPLPAESLDLALEYAYVRLQAQGPGGQEQYIHLTRWEDLADFCKEHSDTNVLRRSWATRVARTRIFLRQDNRVAPKE